ncbi:CrcB protein [Gracilibacillus halotolerans]|uniref:Fluoride-specific ion channel FluC n=1 Tax=Gracilibacillus halotolerans TaxID=74386 RepID=A0A841RI29_9BACI|nr:fluoride efflux transporter CrcB [Gracilibacillus halotolerans]MBB6513850.1 CrcB protein [Gracilibacillus halotolerans]
MVSVLFVGIGGFFGAMARYFVSNQLDNQSDFPLATWLVNMIGSFLLGFLFGLELNSSMFLLAGTGFMGAFTTFSTFKLEGILLHKEKKHRFFIWYNVMTYGGGLLLAWFGWMLGR